MRLLLLLLLLLLLSLARLLLLRLLCRTHDGTHFGRLESACSTLNDEELDVLSVAGAFLSGITKVFPGELKEEAFSAIVVRDTATLAFGI